MKLVLLILFVIAVAVLVLCAALFDTSTLLVAGVALGIVGVFGTLPVLFGVITRRANANQDSPEE